MAQSFPGINATDFISASRQNILDRDTALQSNFSGSTFPTSGLVVGQTCYRTDLQKLYILESIAPDVWRELIKTISLGTAAFKNTGASGDALPLLNVANTFSQEQTFTGGIDFANQLVAGNSGEMKADTDLRLNAYSGKDINFLINGTSKMKLYADGGFTVGAPTGNSKGNGTLNAQSMYLNGTALGDAATKLTGLSTGKIPLYENFGSLAFLSAALTANITDYNVTLPKLARMTAGALISFDPASTPVGTPKLILPDTAGYVLTSNGIGAMPSYQKQSGSQRIATLDYTVSSGTDVRFTLDWTTYYDFELRFRDVFMDAIANNTDGSLRFKTSIDGGSTFMTASQLHNRYEQWTTSGTGTGTNSDGGAILSYADLIVAGDLQGDQSTLLGASAFNGACGNVKIMSDTRCFMGEYEVQYQNMNSNYVPATVFRRGRLAHYGGSLAAMSNIGRADAIMLYATLTTSTTARNIFGMFELWGRKR